MFDPLRLLALHELIGDLPAGQAVLGMRADGRPAVVDLATRHLQIVGPSGAGKSELLRTALVSLCLDRSPAELRCLGIDADGRQLSLLEGLPQMQRRLAIGLDAGHRLLRQLELEAARRRAGGISGPDWIAAVDAPIELNLLQRCMDRLSGSRIRLMLAGGPPMTRADCRVARGLATGRFELDSVLEFQAAYLPAADLNRVVRALRARSRGAQWLPAVLPLAREPQMAELFLQ